MQATASTGNQSARGPNSSRKLKGTLTAGPRTNDFLTLVEQQTDAFVKTDDSEVEEVRKILADVRQQYDRVNSEAEKRSQELARLREAIRVADATGGAKADELHAQEESKVALQKQYEDTVAAIDDAQTNRKVYHHMLERILKEQAVLKEKMLKMDGHLDRKKAEESRKIIKQRKQQGEKVQSSVDLELLEQDVEYERAARDAAMRRMKTTLDSKQGAIKRRQDFERWRHAVRLEAANEAFQASAGRLRKLYAIEKLAGNCLQKITFEQVERSQATEDGFQKIREVTGLTDVMDIVHKFLNRDVEHEQLKSSVKEAEKRLEELREDFDRLKRDTNGITFDPDAASRSRDIYMEVEDHEARLNEALKDHEQSRARLQRTTIVVEHMKRWASRMSKSLAAFDEPSRLEKPADLPAYFGSMNRTIEKFVQHVATQIQTGKVQRKTMSQAASKEYHEQARLLNDKDFLKSNCRVPAAIDGRPASARQAAAGGDEDPSVLFNTDREKYKGDSHKFEQDANRKLELEKKKGGAKAM